MKNQPKEYLWEVAFVPEQDGLYTEQIPPVEAVGNPLYIGTFAVVSALAVANLPDYVCEKIVFRRIGLPQTGQCLPPEEMYPI